MKSIGTLLRELEMLEKSRYPEHLKVAGRRALERELEERLGPDVGLVPLNAPGAVQAPLALPEPPAAGPQGVQGTKPHRGA